MQQQYDARAQPARQDGVALPGDSVSEVLRSLRLEGLVHFRCDFSAPWGLAAPSSHNAEFHFVMEGEGWVDWPGAGAAERFCAGDLIVFPRGVSHSLRDSLESAATPVGRILAGQRLERYGPVVFGGDGTRTQIVCGCFRFHCDRPHPLVQTLPPIIHLRAIADVHAQPWRQTIELVAREVVAMEAGARAAINRLVEVLFIQVVRNLVARGTLAQGLLAALSDRHLGPVLLAVHANLAAQWSVAKMANEAALSRAAFAQRFHRLVGEAPMSYLTRVRMEAANDLLMSGARGVADAAEQVGYRSEAAFARVYKRVFGTGPGQARRAR